MARLDTDTPTIPPRRLIALADGVFAIVMTLLVFQLAVPLAAGNRLASSDLDPGIARGGKRMGFVYLSTMLVATSVSLFSPVAAYVLYGSMPGRAEEAAMRRPPRRPVWWLVSPWSLARGTPVHVNAAHTRTHRE